MPTFISIIPCSVFMVGMASVCFFHGYHALIFYKRTKDLSYLPLCITQIFGGVHLLILLSAMVLYTLLKDAQILLFLVISARIFLYIGILSFIQFPVLAQSSVLYRHKTIVISVMVLIIGVFSFLQFQTSPDPFVSDRGFIVENIQSPIAVLLMIFVPTCIILVEAISFLKIIPPQASRFFKTRVYFLSSGILLAVLGNSFYILSHSPKQTLMGIILVMLGYTFIGLGISILNIRKLFLRG